MSTLVAFGFPLTVLTISAAALWRFCLEFGYPPSIFTCHLGIVWSVLAVASLIFGNSVRTARRLGAMILGVGTALLLLIYMLSYFSNRTWGDNMTMGLLWSFLRHDREAWGKITEGLGGRTTLGLVILGGVGLAATAHVAAHRCLSAIGRVLSELPAASSVSLRIAGIVVLGLVPALLLVREALTSPQQFRGEPLLGTLLGWPTVLDVTGSDRFRKEAAVLDELARQRYPAAPLSRGRNVVIVMFDSLRADHLPMYGYRRDTAPFMSSLARHGEIFPVAFAASTCSESFCGIASTFASRYYHHISPKNFRLHEILRRAGYRTVFVLTGNHRQWAGLGDFYGSDVDLWYDYMTTGVGMHDDRAVLKGLDELPPADGRPTFFFFFLMSTHVLGDRLPEYETFVPAQLGQHRSLWAKRSLSASYPETVGRAFDPSLLGEVVNYYDNGVRQGDAILQAIFSVLSRKRYLEDALLIIVGDHGDSLGEHDHLGHNLFLYNEDIRVPFIVWSTERRRPQNLEFASHVDVAPTVLDFVGLPIPETFEGASLFSAPPRDYSIHQTRRGAQPCAAVLARDRGEFRKLILCVQPDGSLGEQLFDLAKDPGETSNLVDVVSPGEVSALRDKLGFFRSTIVNSCTTDDCLE